MTLKEVRKEAVNGEEKHRSLFHTISKQKEIGWYVETKASQRTVFMIHKNGSLSLFNSDFARNYQRQYLPNIRLIKA